MGPDGTFSTTRARIVDIVTVTDSPQSALTTEPDGVRVIAKASKTIIVLVALTAIPALWTAFTRPSILAFLWLIPHVVFVARVAQLRLTVSQAGVTIRNFWATTVVPVWEAEIEVRAGEDTVLLSDAGGKLDTEGRVLYIKRPWGDNDSVHVGVAPRFGREFDRIHDELVAAIAEQRAA